MGKYIAVNATATREFARNWCSTVGCASLVQFLRESTKLCHSLRGIMRQLYLANEITAPHSAQVSFGFFLILLPASLVRERTLRPRRIIVEFQF